MQFCSHVYRVSALSLTTLLFGCTLGEVRLNDNGRQVHASIEAPPARCRRVVDVSAATFSIYNGSYDSILNELKNKTAEAGGNFLQIEPSNPLRRGVAFECNPPVGTTTN